MTTEQLRDTIVKFVDKGLESWVLRRSVGENGVRLLRAMRTFWHRAPADALDTLNGYLEAEPILREVVAPTAESCGWRKGPLPPDTYNWGGVVPVGEESPYGFYFADFRGDHVILEDGKNTRLEADQVAWFNNCLELPGAKRFGGAK